MGEFEVTMENPQILSMMKEIGMSYDDAGMLFRLLDVDGSGGIDPNELIQGCVRLQGSAKAIDFAAFLRDFWNYLQIWQAHAQDLKGSLARIESHLGLSEI